MDTKGPIRVLGGAGTSKTVVAMLRAKRSVSVVFSGNDDRILFLVFSTNLAADVRSNLAEMSLPEELSRIEVTNIDAWINSQLSKRGLPWTISYGSTDHCWRRAIELQDYYVKHKIHFLKSEF